MRALLGFSPNRGLWRLDFFLPWVLVLASSGGASGGVGARLWLHFGGDPSCFDAKCFSFFPHEVGGPRESISASLVTWQYGGSRGAPVRQYGSKGIDYFSCFL
eukprot:Gb_33983 [translate_table: standard]